MPLVKGRCPEIDTPVPWPVPVAVEGVVPGARMASALKFRAMVGRSSICLLLTIVAIVLCVSTAMLCPTTSHRLGDSAHFHREIDREVLTDAQFEPLPD